MTLYTTLTKIPGFQVDKQAKTFVTLFH